MTDIKLTPRLSTYALFILFFCVLPTTVSFCQQPFFTDDADVTEKGKFHFELTNEFDRLHPTSLPDKYQNGLRGTLAYGVAKNVEISVGGQFFSIRSVGPQAVTRGGFGDSTISVKYNFLKERENSRLPALAISGLFAGPDRQRRAQLWQRRL